MLHSKRTPSCLELVDLGVDDRVRQAEVGNAVLEHAARLVEGLVDRDVAAGLGHVGRAGHAGRAGADDADAEPVAARCTERSTSPRLIARSPTQRSSRPMATGSSVSPTVQTPSHWFSCGQTRPQTAGSRFVAVMTS